MITQRNEPLRGKAQWVLQPRSRNRNPLDELERAPNRLRPKPPGGNATTRGISVAYPVLLHHPDPGLL